MFHLFSRAIAIGFLAGMAATSSAWGADALIASAPTNVSAATPAAAPTAKAAGAPVAAPAAPLAPSASAAPAAGNAAAAAPAVAAAAAAASAPAAPVASLDTRIQDVKGEVIRLNRDLLVLEEELLFPANTQVALFVSMDVGKMFELDSVQVKLDDKVVANYLYTPAEVTALHRGGVQRVFVGNLRAGEHTLVAFFTGGGPHDRDYKRATTIKFEKGTEPKYIELQIRDSQAKLQPEFDVKVWQ